MSNHEEIKFLVGLAYVMFGAVMFAYSDDEWFGDWPTESRIIAALATGLLWPAVLLCLALRFVAVGVWQIVGMARAKMRTRDDGVPAAKVVRR